MLTAVGAGCANNAYQRAAETGTPDAYRSFLQANPSNAHVDEARDRLTELDYAEACKRHSILAYRRFLEEHPRSPDAPDVRMRLESLRFNAATERGTAQGYRDFLNDHPDGAHHGEVEHRLAQLETARVEADDPIGKDNAAFQEALGKGPYALGAYLEAFPAGAHREDAHRALFSAKLDGLLFSGLFPAAREEARRSPLTAGLPDLEVRFSRAKAAHDALSSKDARIQATRADFYVRSFSELTQALESPDPLDRWEAAEELGQLVDVRTLEPLLRTFRTARNPLVRQAALASLFTVTRALPRYVSQYELATRVAALRANAGSAEVYLPLAVLLDLSGQPEAATTEYRRSFDAEMPDPVVLHRWIEIREARHEPFSAAVAARQLALWAQSLASGVEPGPDAELSIATARELCAAAVEAREAHDAVVRAQTGKLEFPDDVRAFEKLSAEALRLARAKLGDAELVLQERHPGLRTCAEQSVRMRIQRGVQQRSDALATLKRTLPKAAPAVLQAVAERDPSFEVRAVAQALRPGSPAAER